LIEGAVAAALVSRGPRRWRDRQGRVGEAGIRWRSPRGRANRR